MRGSTEEMVHVKNRLDDLDRKMQRILTSLNNIEAMGFPGQMSSTQEKTSKATNVVDLDMENWSKETAQMWSAEFMKALSSKRHYGHASRYCPYPSPFPNEEQVSPEYYTPHLVLDPLSKENKFKYCRAYIYHFMHNESLNRGAELFEYFIFFLIVISSSAYILSTVDSYDTNLWELIEIIVSICFTVEYVARIISVKNLHWYVIQPLNVIDLMAVIPWYIEKSTGAQGTGLRVLRVVRLCRIFRLRSMMAEYSEIVIRAIVKTISQSSGMVSFIILLELSVCSSLMYVIEKDEDSGFTSIPISMYWCMVTITTVGYGDMYPATDLGRLLACFTMFTGLIVIACVVIVFGGNFEESQTKFFERKKYYALDDTLRTQISDDEREQGRDSSAGKRIVIVAKELNDEECVE